MIAGVLLVLALTVGGFLLARTVGRASAGPQAATRLVTLRRERAGGHGRVLTREQVRKLYSQAQTVLRTQTIQTPGGVRVVTHPVVLSRVVHRTNVVTRPGETRIVTRQVTDSRVVTREVTVVATTTVVSTRTDTLPFTITVTVP